VIADVIKNSFIFVFYLSGYFLLTSLDEQFMNDLLVMIFDPKINQETLIHAIQNLGSNTESAHFWVRIANSQEYRQDHRRRAVFQLFQRHVVPGVRLSELAQILDNPSWLADDDVSVVTLMAGEVPVKLTPEDTVFVLPVFPNLPDGRYENWAIYLRVLGQVDRESFINILRGKPVAEAVSNAKVLEFALSPDDPTNVNW
jgi:hypothetical protein